MLISACLRGQEEIKMFLASLLKQFQAFVAAPEEVIFSNCLLCRLFTIYISRMFSLKLQFYLLDSCFKFPF